jgi:site-specific DNA-methyltransferase (adenine-specific)
MNKLDMESKDIVDENIQKISELFPNVIVESDTGKTIDFDMLKQELSKDIVEGVKEKYQLTWPGKKEAIVNANTPSKSTLRPLKEKSVDFDNTQNIYIEGDNLEVLKILQESYLNKIKCIYIDPPYNTGNDFIYNDKFKKDIDEELLESGQVDEEGNRMVTNNQSNGRFHSDWLSMIYPRLKLARNLLTDDGVIVISISDMEIDNLKKICNEIFGENNYCGDIIWNSTKSVTNTALISVSHTYNLVYFKNMQYFIENRLEFRIPEDGEGFKNPDNDPRGPWKADPFQVGGWRPNQQYEIKNPNTGVIYKPNEGCSWKNDYSKFEELMKDNRIVFGKNGDSAPQRKRFMSEALERGKVVKTIWDDVETTTNGTMLLKKLFNNVSLFDNPKPLGFMKRILQLCTNKDSIILDFFSGSATTAHAVLDLNLINNEKRKYILVQLPEKCDEKSIAYKNGYKTICEIGEERIRRAGKKIKEETNADIDYGFRVYKTDTTNMKDVYYIPNDLEQGDLLELELNIKEDRTTDDLLTQVILDLGLTLDLNIEEKMIGKNKVYYVAGNSLVACFDDKIDIDIVDKICECKPYKVVFKDSAFKTDNDKINIEERFKKLLPQRANDSGFINIL